MNDSLNGRTPSAGWRPRLASGSVAQPVTADGQKMMRVALRKKNTFFVQHEARYAKLTGFMTMNMKKHLIKLMTVAGILGGIASVLAETKPAPPPPPAPAENKEKEASGPKIQFEQTVYDFGKVNSGELVKHSFVFTNVGTATLE